MKVLTSEIYHETNTFSSRSTDLKAFRNRLLLFKGDAVSERGSANTELAGFLRAGENNDWEIDHVISASAGPSGKVTDEAFEYLIQPLIKAVSESQYDGILLGLHGAMVSESYDDGEGEILNRLRKLVGSEIPIAITLDLHANVSKQMCALANIIVSYKTYPHIDMFETGLQAGEILAGAMRGKIKPSTILVSCPMLEEVNGGRTDLGPMVDRIARARHYEESESVYAVSINGGFPGSDIPEVGPTVLVTGEGDMSRHRNFARSIAYDIWEHRHDVANDYMSVDSAAAIAAEFESGKGPLIIADYSDNPGAGAYGDSTNLLAALLTAKIRNACFAPIVDAEVALQLQSSTVGDRIPLHLGGKTEPGLGGGPLEVDAELILISNGDYVGKGAMAGGLHASFGPTAVIRVEGIDILVVSISNQILDLEQFRTFGIEPTSKAVIGLKSMQHFRADFEPIAGKVIVCDSQSLCTTDYARMNFRKIPRPIFPLDQFEFQPEG